MLSWGAHRTLINTLESYQTFGIDAQEKLIFFQEISSEDKRIADKYGWEWRYLGAVSNVGIAQAYKDLVEMATDDWFLFLENDWVALESGEAINEAQELLYERSVDVVRLRHRRFPGNPLWTLQFKGDEYSRPTHLLDSVHWQEYPDQIFDEIEYTAPWYITTAVNANWTNNPTMFKTDFLREYILPRIGTRDAEVDLQPWWEQQDFVVAQHDVGIFTHKRIG